MGSSCRCQSTLRLPDTVVLDSLACVEVHRGSADSLFALVFFECYLRIDQFLLIAERFSLAANAGRLQEVVSSIVA